MTVRSMQKLNGPFGGTWEVKDTDGSTTVEVDGVVVASTGVKTVAAATTLTANDNGKTIILDAAEGAAVTLPALADGLKFKIVVGAAFATSNWVVASSEGDNISGIIIVNGASVPASAEDQINFVASAESIGDFIELIADSGNSQWLVSGAGNSAGSITATDPA